MATITIVTLWFSCFSSENVKCRMSWGGPRGPCSWARQSPHPARKEVGRGQSRTRGLETPKWLHQLLYINLQSIYLYYIYIYTVYIYIYVSMIIYWRHFKTKVMFLSFNWGNWFLGDWIVDGGCKDLMARGYQLCWYWTKPIFLECKSHWSHRNNQLF